MPVKKRKIKKPNSSWFRKVGVPTVLIPGLIVAATLGWKGWEKLGPEYLKYGRVFPKSGVVEKVVDGDTVMLKSGVVIRLIGVDAPNRGEEKSKEAGKALEGLVGKQKIWLEYDRNQNDQYGRALAWVWVNCESTPMFLSADYMKSSGTEVGLMGNPEGCKDGSLVQEEMIRMRMVEVETYPGRGELKYEKRMESCLGVCGIGI